MSIHTTFERITSDTWSVGTSKIIVTSFICFKDLSSSNVRTCMKFSGFRLDLSDVF